MTYLELKVQFIHVRYRLDHILHINDLYHTCDFYHLTARRRADDIVATLATDNAACHVVLIPV